LICQIQIYKIDKHDEHLRFNIFIIKSVFLKYPVKDGA